MIRVEPSRNLRAVAGPTFSTGHCPILMFPLYHPFGLSIGVPAGTRGRPGGLSARSGQLRTGPWGPRVALTSSAGSL